MLSYNKNTKTTHTHRNALTPIPEHHHNIAQITTDTARRAPNYKNSVKISTTNRQTSVLKPMIYQTPSTGAFDQHNLNYSSAPALTPAALEQLHQSIWLLKIDPLTPLLLAPPDSMLASLASFDSLYYFDRNWHSKNVASSNSRLNNLTQSCWF